MVQTLQHESLYYMYIRGIYDQMYLPGGTGIPGGGTPGGGIPGGGTLKSMPGGGWEGMALWYFL